MTLQELYDKIKDISPLNLIPGVLENGNISAYFTSVMPSGEFVIHEPVITLANNDGDDITEIKIEGTSASYGLGGDIPVVLKFYARFGQLYLEATGLMGDQRLSITGLSAGLTDLVVSTNVYDATMPPSGKLSAKTSLLSGVTFSMNYPLQNEVWQFNAELDTPASISALVDLCGGADLIKNLPAPIKTFTDIGVRTVGLSLEADRETKSLKPTYFHLGMGSKTSWQILPMFQLESIWLDAIVASPGADAKVSYSLTGTFQIGDPKTENGLVMLNASMPDMKLYGGLKPGSELYLKDVLNTFIPGVKTNSFQSKFTQFRFLVDPKGRLYTLSGTLETNWDLFSIAGRQLTLQSIAANLQYMNASTTGGLSGIISLQQMPGEEPVIMEVSAEHPASGDGWIFSGSFQEGSKLHLKELLSDFLGFDLLPNGAKIDIKSLSASFHSQTKDYSFDVSIDWGNIFGNDIPLTVSDTTLHLVSSGGSKTGYISGAAELNGVSLTLKYEFTAAKQNMLSFGIFGVEGTLTLGSEPYILTVSPKGKTLGDVASLLVNAASPGSGTTLPSPWDVLNTISLDGFVFTVNFTKKEIGFSYSINTNIGFASINSIGLNYQSGTSKKVMIKLEGSFLGQSMPEPWDMLDPAAAPKVPGKGNELFELKFLGLGQQVRMEGQLPNTVKTGVENMIAAFAKPPGKGNELIFDTSANWLVGTRFVLVNMVSIDALFHDPMLYGLSIGVTSGKFNGLQFEVLYKKINDNTGVYQILLALPPYIRQMEFGALSITLPNIGVWIYTNGDFKLDFGFPANGNFAGSFGIQLLPFVGSGGFYFGKLSSETATQLPSDYDPRKGDFNPVIIFGLGLRMGIGKSVDKGILKAELSLTIQGIIEGTLAFFNAYPSLAEHNQQQLIENPSNADRPVYYHIQGQLAIVGKVYGEINFSIISATLELIVTISTRAVIEAYRAMLVNFTASVSVSLKVSINLGIFSISIRVSFSTSITETFLLGSNDPSAPWASTGLRTRKPVLLSLTGHQLSEPSASMFWQPVYTQNVPGGGPKQVSLYFAPQFTATSDTLPGQPAAARNLRGLAMLFIPSSAASGQRSTFSTLARGILTWTLNAYYNKDLQHPTENDVLDKDVRLEDLQAIYRTLCQEPFTGSENAFGYEQVMAFLSNYFKFTVTVPSATLTCDQLGYDPNEIETGVFPMFPMLSLDTPTGSVDFGPGASIRFSQTELDLIKAYFRQLREPGDKAPLAADSAQEPESLAHYIFLDYFLIIAKAALQAAIDKMRALALEVSQGETLADMASRYPNSGISLEELAFANRTRKINQGIRLRINGASYTLRKGDTLQSIAARFDLAAEQTAMLNSLQLSPGESLILPGFYHTAGPGQDLRTIAGMYGISLSDLAQQNSMEKNLFAAGKRIIYPNIEQLNAGELLDLLQEQADFDHISGLAARVLLQGLKPPSPTSSVYKGAPAAFYALSLQAFDAAPLVENDKIILRMTAGETPSWLDLGNSSTLELKIDAAIVTFLGKLKAARFSPAIREISALPLAAIQPKSFSLGTQISWTNTDQHSGPTAANASIWPLPDQLTSILQPDNQTSLTLYTQVQEHELAVADPVIIAQPIWCMKLDIQVRKSQDSNKATFELVGAGQKDCHLLESLLSYYAQPRQELIEHIHVLYPQASAQKDQSAPPIGLCSMAEDEVSLFIVQSNLSTASHPPALFAANAPEPVSLLGQSGIEFLKLLWECSVTGTGGYHLYYAISNGQSLPDFLFNENPVAAITLLVSFKLPAGVPQFINSAVIHESIDTAHEAVFARVARAGGPELQEKISSVAPGHIGFQLEREDPSLTADLDQRQLLELYNLLEYQLSDSELFKASNPAIPAGPTDSDHLLRSNDPDRNFAPPALNSLPWCYQATFPVYRLVKNIPPAIPGHPSPGDNPYLAITGTSRQTATLSLGWNDIFGNSLSADDPQSAASWPNLPIEIGYTDELIAPAQWRNTLATFLILAQDAKPALTISFSFQADRYTAIPDAQARIKNAKSDLAHYASIYYQLWQPDVVVSVSSSMDAQDSNDISQQHAKEQLLDFIASIYRFLLELANGQNTPAPPTDLALSWKIGDLNPATVFMLTVHLTIARNAQLVSPEFSDQPNCSSVTSLISPDLAVGGKTSNKNAKQTLSLQEFAQCFQSLFPQLKVLTGPATSGQEIWIARFAQNNGIWVTFSPGQPNYFAVKPLSVNLLSDAQMTVFRYITGQKISATATDTKSFNSIDIELQATAFLSALDLFLSPTYIIPARILESQPVAAGISSYKELIEAKKTLAETIADQLTPIFQDLHPSPLALAQARESLKQELLVKLSNASTINTVVQFGAAVSTSLSGSANLYGKPIDQLKQGPNSDKELPYSLSAAKIALATNDQYQQARPENLTFMFSASNPSGRPYINMSPKYVISAMEINIVPVKGIKGYMASDWLSFVLPFEVDGMQTDLGNIDIPIPLKIYPTPPSVLDQKAAALPLKGPNATSSEPEKLTRAKQWSYGYTYDNRGAGQDTIHASIGTNLPSGDKLQRKGGSEPDLFTALMQFSDVYPAIQADLNNYLVTGTSEKNALAAVQSFAWLASRVAKAWKTWGKDRLGYAGASSGRSLDFSINQYPGQLPAQNSQKQKPLLFLQISTEEQLLGLPAVTIEKYKAEKIEIQPNELSSTYVYKDLQGNYLDYDLGISIPGRTLTLPDPFNVLLEENAAGGVAIIRNQNLGIGRKVASDFIFKTPLIRMINPAQPLLRPDISIDMALFAKDDHTLKGILSAFLQQLFQEVTEPGTTVSRTITLSVSYRYVLDQKTQQSATPLTAQLPILLTSPYQFNIPRDWDTADTNAMVSQIGSYVIGWFDKNKPIRKGGTLEFSCSLYSSVTDSNLPVLTLDRISLAISSISDLPDELNFK